MQNRKTTTKLQKQSSLIENNNCEINKFNKKELSSKKYFFLSLPFFYALVFVFLSVVIFVTYVYIPIGPLPLVSEVFKEELKLNPLPQKIILGYPNWAQCGDGKIIQSVQNGVNVLAWFSIDLTNDENDKSLPKIFSRVNVTCVAETAKSIRELGLDDSVTHLISIGGWNSPHPVTTMSPEKMFQEFDRWNKEVVSHLELGFQGFDGLDWDVEGNNDLGSPYNHLSSECIHFMGRFSQLAKKKHYIVSIAPAESYLDPTTPLFDRSLKHDYQEWKFLQPKFSYHGLNSYAPFLSSAYSSTFLNNGEVVDTFDFVMVQLYEGYSHACYNITRQNQSVTEYLHNFVHQITSPFEVQFSNDQELNIPTQYIQVPLHKLIIGLANGWASGAPDSKFLALTSEDLAISYNNLSQSNLTPLGYGFWNIQDEGKNGIFLARGLNDFLHIRRT